MSNYLRWSSSLSASDIFTNAENHSYPHPHRDGVIYLSQLKDENRSVLVFDSGQKVHVLTPKGFSLRTSINEYGGKPFWLDGNAVIFSNQVDQCLYRQELSGVGASVPLRITCEPQQSHRYCYTDINVISDDLIVAIVERQYGDCSRENDSFLGLIDPASQDCEPIELQDQADFHSNLVFDHDGQRLAWVQWHHPNMPWDNTELMIANIRVEQGTGAPEFETALSDIQRVPIEANASVGQLMFASNGTLFFSADFPSHEDDDPKNYWNIYALTAKSIQNDDQHCDVVSVTNDLCEFGYPHWQFGNTRIVQFDNDRLLTIRSSAEFDEVLLIDQETYQVCAFENDACHYDNLCSDGGGTVFAIRLSKTERPAVSRMRIGEPAFSNMITTPSILSEDETSVGRHISFECEDGRMSYGFYYPPVNTNYADADSSIPPLLIMVHGGPSARAYGSFDLQKQYWTQRGFAIFDVNHRGSSGYGRNFRDALYGYWGELDCSDIIEGVNYLSNVGLADSSRICIRGKSAGGFTVLRALTEYPQVFAAGACYYGIANLVTLASSTHKFEKYYSDRLIGEKFDADNSVRPESRYFKRSPINKIHSLSSAMIVFQGSLDKVVPPMVAHELVNVLNDLGLPHTYIEYADEAHGFKRSENNINALENELKFYRTAFAVK